MAEFYDDEPTPEDQAADKRRQSAETMLADAWADVLATKAGRLVVWHMLAECRLYSPTFTGNSWGNFQEGRRAVGLEVLARIHETDPRHYILMQQEALADDRYQMLCQPPK